MLHAVRYDTLCARPVEALARLADHCDLPRDERFDHWLARQRLTSRDHAWREQVSAADQQVIDDLLEPCVALYEAATRTALQ